MNFTKAVPLVKSQQTVVTGSVSQWPKSVVCKCEGHHFLQIGCL